MGLIPSPFIQLFCENIFERKMAISGSRIPRRKRVAQFSETQSKVRVLEEAMVEGLERMSLSNSRTVERLENDQEWIQAVPATMTFSAQLAEYLKNSSTRDYMLRTIASRIPRPTIQPCMTVALYKPRPALRSDLTDVAAENATEQMEMD